MRLGEAFAVTWNDIDLNNKTIDINKQLQYSNAKKVWYLTDPKYKSCRAIDIDGGLVDTLRTIKAMQDDNKLKYGELYTNLYEQEYTRDISTSGDTVADFINVRENGEFIQPRIMQHTSTVIQHELGITEFTFHSLRHTHASILLENHCDAKYVQKRLGHKNIQETVNIYQHLTQSIRDENKQKLDDIF